MRKYIVELVDSKTGEILKHHEVIDNTLDAKLDELERIWAATYDVNPSIANNWHITVGVAI